MKGNGRIARTQQMFMWMYAKKPAVTLSDHLPLVRDFEIPPRRVSSTVDPTDPVAVL